MNKFWVITRQVYKRRVKTKSFLFSLLFPIIIAAFIVGLPKIIDYFDSGDMTKIAILSDNEAFIAPFEKDKDYFQVKTNIQTEESAKKALSAGKLDGYLKITDTEGQISAVYTTEETAGQEVLSRITTDLTAAKVAIKAEDYKITEAQLQDITSPVPVKNHVESTDQLTNKQKEVMNAAILVLTLLIFIFVMSYANIVASEIATEKGTRIMEVILSSVTATTHLLAKLTAIILMLLTQIGFYAVVSISVMLAMKNTDLVKGILDQLSAFPPYYLILNLLFILFGLLLYIILSAMVGSMVPNVETVAQFIYPLTMLSILGYWGSIAASNVPDNILVIIGSYVPMFSPMMMLARMDLLSVSNAGIFISLGILILTTALAFLLTLKLYKGNVLLYSNDGLFKTFKKSFSYAKKYN
ncbi:ABC transporter permease [Listeria fleischmannii]|uniref:ABC transporter permease n=1 Tax=Listeria fleischmannii TaxID=1069827 RepID=A0A841YDM8_9LIST|nr:ABC transporter permease [Listeria fleischmannii]MBC1398339.1 ABC transporter permease [Listeria fleischmannii]MBC1426400.1 ABC transporter permease [Listeria fleischmannii]STY35670.1 ABC-2 family transporter protein [Listeria fleischmannii subsp. coloradonensis]